MGPVERILVNLLAGLTGSLSIRAELVADMSGQNGGPVDLRLVATEAGCELMEGRTIGPNEEPEFSFISKKTGGS